ncbi:hypothetical protein B0H17DRAFT_1032089, partial [Mycena rosella]
MREGRMRMTAAGAGHRLGAFPRSKSSPPSLGLPSVPVSRPPSLPCIYPPPCCAPTSCFISVVWRSSASLTVPVLPPPPSPPIPSLLAAPGRRHAPQTCCSSSGARVRGAVRSRARTSHAVPLPRGTALTGLLPRSAWPWCEAMGAPSASGPRGVRRFDDGDSRGVRCATALLLWRGACGRRLHPSSHLPFSPVPPRRGRPVLSFYCRARPGACGLQACLYSTCADV